MYRARNTARGLKEKPEDLGRRIAQERLDTLKTYQSAIENLLFDERAMVPVSAFHSIHTLKNGFAKFIVGIESYRRLRMAGKADDAEQMLADIASTYETLDELYEDTVADVQELLQAGGGETN